MPPSTYKKGTIATDDWRAFEDKYHFRPNGEVDSALKNVWAAKTRAESGSIAGPLKAAWERFKNANANWKEIVLAYRAEKIEEWNADHGWVNGEPPAEESSSDDEDEDGVLTNLPQFREGIKENYALEKILEECPELVGAQSLTPAEARAHARRLAPSTAPDDEEIKKKAWEHSDKRWAAHKAKVARTGRKLRGGRSAVNPALRTRIKAVNADWSGEATAALTAAVEEEATTPRRVAADESIWERIASTVNSKIAGAKYTGTQCCSKAESLGLLKPALPDPHLYHPDLPPNKPNLDGLPKDVPRGRDARDAFMALPMVALYWLMGFVYNAYIPLPHEKNRKEVVDALVAAEMCACDPNDHGVEVPYLKTPAFTRAFSTKHLQRMGADRSNAALERAMGDPSKRRGKHGGPISGSDKAGYARLTMSKLLKMFSLEFAPRLGEHPTKPFYSEVIEYFTTCKYLKHDDFDAKQDCAVCHGLFIDLGGRVFCGYQRYNHCAFELESISTTSRRHSPVDLPAGEHRHSEKAGILAVRENGACLRCNSGWIAKFDALGLERDAVQN